MKKARPVLPPYHQSLAGSLLAAREAVMAPIRPVLRNAGVTEQQWRVLRVLADEKEIDLSRLAGRALLHGPSVTRILRELVDRKLVVRNADPADGRRSVIGLSKAGHALLRSTIPHSARLLAAYRETFGAERLAALVAELQALSQAISVFTSPEYSGD